jgi:light-regulated signal transduction histidine kinase (bacteriophytochrome)
MKKCKKSLMFCQIIVECHGGTMDVESQLDEVSIF